MLQFLHNYTTLSSVSCLYKLYLTLSMLISLSTSELEDLLDENNRTEEVRGEPAQPRVGEHLLSDTKGIQRQYYCYFLSSIKL